MLPDPRNDLLHLLNMLEGLEKIGVYSRGITDAEIFYTRNEQLNFNACLNLLAQLGESCGELSAELLKAAPEIEWRKIRGLRNRIAHDYLGLDAVIIFRIVEKEVPALKRSLYLLLKQRLDEGVLDPQELAAARRGEYYGHVDFDRLEGD